MNNRNISPINRNNKLKFKDVNDALNLFKQDVRKRQRQKFSSNIMATTNLLDTISFKDKKV